MSSTSIVRAQENGIVDIDIGWSSDSALAAVPRTYEVIDTIRSFTGEKTLIRIAPVPLAGMDGLLVLHIDSTSTVSELYWTRIAGGRYTKSGALAKYAGWDSWQLPTSEELAAMLEQIRSVLGEGRDGTMRPMRIDEDEELAKRDEMRMIMWPGANSRTELRVLGDQLQWMVLPMGWPEGLPRPPR